MPALPTWHRAGWFSTIAPPADTIVAPWPERERAMRAALKGREVR